MKRVLILAAAAATSLGVLTPTGAMAAKAKPKPPVKKSFTATSTAVDPTNVLYEEPNTDTRPSPENFPYTVCEGTPDKSGALKSRHIETLQVSGPGKLVVDLKDFVGDWDMLLLDGQGRELTNAGKGPNENERMTYRAKKAMSFQIVACNWAGGPDAKGNYVYTYNN